MSKGRTKPHSIRRALSAVLCYLLVLQAFAAAFGIAGGIGQTDTVADGFVICHNSGTDTPAPGDAGKPPNAPCALCAVAASAVLLPSRAYVVLAPLAACGTVDFAFAAVITASPFTRAGLARAPPALA